MPQSRVLRQVRWRGGKTSRAAQPARSGASARPGTLQPLGTEAAIKRKRETENGRRREKRAEAAAERNAAKDQVWAARFAAEAEFQAAKAQANAAREAAKAAREAARAAAREVAKAQRGTFKGVWHNAERSEWALEKEQQ